MNRISRNLLAVAGMAQLCAGVASAQQTAGRVFNPRAHPANTDLVAFERLDTDRRELQFMALSSGAISSLRAASAATPSGVIGLPDLAGPSNLATFSGDLDWRPGTSGAPHGFAYVASGDRGLGLFLNAVDARGQVTMITPVRVPFTGNARQPRWSRDGRNLVFVSDSGAVFVVANAGQALSSGNAASLTAKRLTSASTPALFPEWAPGGDYIAYQVEKNVNGEKRFAIEVVPMNGTDGAGPVVSLTDGLAGENAYRPSWSPDGKSLAFYVDRSGQGGNAQVLDIGVMDAQRDTRGMIFRGDIKEGRSRRLAEGVIPNQSRGPAWTWISDPSGSSKLAITFVSKDEARNNPILVAGVQRWIDMRARNEFEVPLSTTWGTSNHKDVFVAQDGGNTRYIYASVTGGGERVAFHDVPVVPPAFAVAVRTQQPVAATTNVEQAGNVKSGSRSVLPAALLPGGAQFSQGKPVKGLALLAMGATGAGIFFYCASQDPAPKYHCSNTDGSPKMGGLIHTGGGIGLFLGSIALGIVDGVTSNRSSKLRVGVDRVPARSGADGRDALSFKIGYSGLR